MVFITLELNVVKKIKQLCEVGHCGQLIGKGEDTFKGLVPQTPDKKIPH